jgi:hypothetical protein
VSRAYSGRVAASSIKPTLLSTITGRRNNELNLPTAGIKLGAKAQYYLARVRLRHLSLTEPKSHDCTTTGAARQVVARARQESATAPLAAVALQPGVASVVLKL